MEQPLIAHASDAIETNPRMVYVVLWFLARVIRDVKGKQEGFAMTCSHHSDGITGYGMKGFERPSDMQRGWQLLLAEWVIGCLLFGSHHPYRVRLQNTRWGQSVDLEEFRSMLGVFLELWSSEHTCQCSCTLLGLISLFIDSNLLVRVPGLSCTTNFEVFVAYKAAVFVGSVLCFHRNLSDLRSLDKFSANVTLLTIPASLPVVSHPIHP